MAAREEVRELVAQSFPAEAGVREESGGDIQTFQVDRAVLPDVARFLKGTPELSFKLLLDICGADYPARSQRFEVVYHLASLDQGHRVRLKVPVAESEVEVPSVYPVWKAADWFEREVFDLFGVRFSGHPNLKRILCHQSFQGHALRKDYDPGQRWLLNEAEEDEPVWAGKGDETGDHLETQILSLGPVQPAPHGPYRTVLRLDGEVITNADVEIGYLHRCFEKLSENLTWNQVIPYTDRLNSCSAMMNGVGYALAVEAMLGVESPARAQAIRLILSELSRIMDHFVCLGAVAGHVGATTPSTYMFQVREEVNSILEACCGGRVTVSYVRVGGLANDVPPDFEDAVRYVLGRVTKQLNEAERLLTSNRVFRLRTEDIGAISAEDAVDWGWTGPCLRASGVAYDVRKASPYLGYENHEFSVPVASTGDTFARCLVRVEEVRQSVRIIEQALARLESGPVITGDHRVAPPPKDRVYTEMDSLIRHFKLITDGMKVPPGEAYGFTEGANGELGYYLVSDGSGKPYRVHVRPPCFAVFQAYPHLLPGHMVPDSIAILGSLNVIAGELDR